MKALVGVTMQSGVSSLSRTPWRRRYTTTRPSARTSWPSAKATSWRFWTKTSSAARAGGNAPCTAGRAWPPPTASSSSPPPRPSRRLLPPAAAPQSHHQANKTSTRFPPSPNPPYCRLPTRRWRGGLNLRRGSPPKECIGYQPWLRSCSVKGPKAQQAR